MVELSRKRVFPKTKGDSITGQDRAQKHCDFRFSQIEKKSKVAVLQLIWSPAIVSFLPLGSARLCSCGSVIYTEWSTSEFSMVFVSL